MISIDNITGRLGNKMFLFAFAYNYARKNKISDRYFQDPMFFKEYADEIKSFFQEGILSSTDAIAIHVRRGDYVNHSFYVDLMKVDYYQKAMTVMFPGERFIVFSDDIEWCKTQEVFKNCEFMHGTELEDMNNMASCRGHIIANSSFSWWAAWISPHSRIVVAPSREHWYSDGIERTFCPDNWVRL